MVSGKISREIYRIKKIKTKIYNTSEHKYFCLDFDLWLTLHARITKATEKFRQRKVFLT